MKSFDYGKIAQFYDDVELQPLINEKLVENLTTLFLSHKVNSIWDAACGTGAQAWPLAQKFKVTATDLSAAMLAKAQAKEPSGQVDFLLADMLTFSPLNKVEAIIAHCNALSHLTKTELSTALAHFADILPSRGLLCADVDNRSFIEANCTGECEVTFQAGLYTRTSFMQSMGEGMYKVQDCWEKTAEVVNQTWELQTWYAEEILELLETHGFRLLYWANRALEPCELTSTISYDGLGFVAKRR
jgi:ubiquinone/menaquinone biosynthesis C-methylase UbiE